jgi:hypothetical protein
VGDQGAGLRGFGFEGGFVWWVDWGERWNGGVDCGCHCGIVVVGSFVCDVVLGGCLLWVSVKLRCEA